MKATPRRILDSWYLSSKILAVLEVTMLHTAYTMLPTQSVTKTSFSNRNCIGVVIAVKEMVFCEEDLGRVASDQKGGGP